MMAENQDAAPGKAGPEKEKDEKEKGTSRNKHLLTGAAIGIGSAALVAALLYAKRGRKPDRS
jgi:hypothetical protein